MIPNPGCILGKLKKKKNDARAPPLELLMLFLGCDPNKGLFVMLTEHFL